MKHGYWQSEGITFNTSGSHIVQTSSIRMELEAIRQVLLWLKEIPPNSSRITIATDIMAVLTRIRNGWMPDGWHMDDSECVIVTDSMSVLTRIRNGWMPNGWPMVDSEGVCSRITFMYVLYKVMLVESSLKLQTHWLGLTKPQHHSNSALQTSTS